MHIIAVVNRSALNSMVIIVEVEAEVLAISQITVVGIGNRDMEEMFSMTYQEVNMHHTVQMKVQTSSCTCKQNADFVKFG